MDNVPVDLWSGSSAGGFNSVLECCASGASERVAHHSCRDEMVRVDDDHVIGVIDDALAEMIEAADDVDIRTLGASGLIPGLSETNDEPIQGSLIFYR